MLSVAFLSLSLFALRQAPAGTQLHVRLTTPVGTYASKPGSPVSAELIAPVMSPTGEIVLPVGSILNGTVKRSDKVGYGVRDETAALDLEFQEVVFPGGGSVPLATRMN